MTTLTASATLTIGDAATTTDSTSLVVLPVAGANEGPGRLIHPNPSIGTYDYTRPPDESEGIRGDVIVPPVWASTKTLLGAANTLFVGNLRDAIIEERWTQSVACELSHLDMLIAMWTNPPDPSVGYIEWYPTYTSTLGFKVVILNLTAGSKGITTTPLRNQGWVRGPVVLRMRIAGRV